MFHTRLGGSPLILTPLYGVCSVSLFIWHSCPHLVMVWAGPCSPEDCWAGVGEGPVHHSDFMRLQNRVSPELYGFCLSTFPSNCNCVFSNPIISQDGKNICLLSCLPTLSSQMIFKRNKTQNRKPLLIHVALITAWFLLKQMLRQSLGDVIFPRN